MNVNKRGGIRLTTNLNSFIMKKNEYIKSIIAPIRTLYKIPNKKKREININKETSGALSSNLMCAREYNL